MARDGSKTLTKAKYESLVNAWREFPTNPTKVAQMANVAYRTAVKAWELGWPKKGMEPIKTLFAREQQQARAAILARQAAKKAGLLKERDDAIKQAALVRAQEGQMVGLARGSALQAMTVSAQLAGTARKLGERAKVKLEAELAKEPDDPTGLTASAAVSMLDRLSTLMVKINGQARATMELERLHLGQPTETINIITSQSEMTVDEVEARIESATRALSNARRVGGLTVIDGGLKTPVIGKLVGPDDLGPAPRDDDSGVEHAVSSID